MSKQIMVGMLAGAQANDANVAFALNKVTGTVLRLRSVEDEIDEALANGHSTFLELYRFVRRLTNGDGIGNAEFEYDDVVDGMRNALLDCIDCGDPDDDTGWKYMTDVSWVYPDTDDDDLYERLFTENVNALLDCLECVECVLRISKTAAEFLVKHTDEPVFYNKRLRMYSWIIPFFNMPWSSLGDVMLR